MLPYQLHQKLRAGTTTRDNDHRLTFPVLKGLPFWIWDQEQHTEEQAGLTASAALITSLAFQPRIRKNIRLFDYEKILYDSLLTNEGQFQR